MTAARENPFQISAGKKCSPHYFILDLLASSFTHCALSLGKQTGIWAVLHITLIHAWP